MADLGEHQTKGWTIFGLGQVMITKEVEALSFDLGEHTVELNRRGTEMQEWGGRVTYRGDKKKIKRMRFLKSRYVVYSFSIYSKSRTWRHFRYRTECNKPKIEIMYKS